MQLNANKKIEFKKIALLMGALFALSPWASSATALLVGVAIALFLGNPAKTLTSKLSQKLLMYSIVALGAGMNLIKVASVGAHGIGYTAMSITLTLLLGWILGTLLKTESEISQLISFGTAICGGSAIAALAPVLRAKPHSITVSLGIVFLLNSVALLIFPSLGHMMGFSQEQFGLWSALAVHDTSSVVGTGLQYGPVALEIGTTVKLARALWIVPVIFFIGFMKARNDSGKAPENKTKKPWFILGFLICAGIFTWIPQLSSTGHIVEFIGQKGLVLTLYLIGANLTVDSLKEVGVRPLIQGVVLWVCVASTTAFLISHSIIS